MTSHNKHKFGTDKQSQYATNLSQRSGYETLAQAVNDVLGHSIEKDVSVEEASLVIQFLEGLQSDAKSKDDKTKVAGSNTIKSLYATKIRRICESGQKPPSTIDGDSAWVIDRLKRLQQIEHILGTNSQPINGQEQITIEHLVECFGDLDQVAQAFDVPVSTVKSWKPMVPMSRAWEAQCRTNGRVRVPRQ